MTGMEFDPVEVEEEGKKGKEEEDKYEVSGKSSDQVRGFRQLG